MICKASTCGVLVLLTFWWERKKISSHIKLCGRYAFLEKDILRDKIWCKNYKDSLKIWHVTCQIIKVKTIVIGNLVSKYEVRISIIKYTKKKIFFIIFERLIFK